MTKLNMKLVGADRMIKKLSAISEDVKKQVDAETMESANEIATTAELNASNVKVTYNNKVYSAFDTGKLAQTISYRPTEGKELSYSVYALQRYAPYVEFGTGGLVNVPNELKDLAIRFKGAGIRKINMPPRPFLYPAYQVGVNNYIKKLKEMLKRYGKDFS